MKLLKTLNKKFKKYTQGFTDEEVDRIEIHYNVNRQTFEVGMKAKADKHSINTYDFYHESSDPFASLNLLRYRKKLKVIKEKETKK